MDQYVQTCCAGFLPIIHDRTKSVRQRLDEMAQAVLSSDQNSTYSAFYHRPDHQDLHQELSLKICRFLLPHVTEELEVACRRGELSLRRPEVAASYLLHGQIGLIGPSALPLEERMTDILRYADLILSAG